jgi:hypothetical protein
MPRRAIAVPGGWEKLTWQMRKCYLAVTLYESPFFQTGESPCLALVAAPSPGPIKDFARIAALH